MVILIFLGIIAVLLLMTGHLVESRCLQSRRILAVLLPMVSAVGSVYGLLRATGILLYTSDRYTRESLLFDCSNQTIGCTLFFLCAPILWGAVIALMTRK